MITPQQEVPLLAKRLGIDKLYFKREDLHPYKSHKGRSIPYMIDKYAEGGHTRFAISSSGNAALAAALAVTDYNKRFPERPLRLSIFVGPHILATKLKPILDLCTEVISVTRTETPKQTVHMLGKRGEAKSLRQSQDPLATVGYQSLVSELSEIQNLKAVFVPTSSGTLAEALGDNLAIHVVQPTSCCPIASIFDSAGSEEPILADAIVDKVALRKDALVEKIRQTGGNGWVVTNAEIVQAIKLADGVANITLSPNGALGLAGLRKALSGGWKPTGSVACLVTGK